MGNQKREETMINISAVERDTGLSKDTLRMWERRYTFPKPRRDPNGERAYTPGEVEKLRLIKRLMDRGYRPGKIIGQSVEALQSLGSKPADEAAMHEDIDVFLRLIKAHELTELRRQLAQTAARQGLHNFVLDTVAPLNIAVGEAWMRGYLAVFEEHLYSELIRNMLRNAIAMIQPQGRAPRVLLTSLPGELHGLGLLMAEALLVVEGSSCIPLGTETPTADIVAAAQAHRADIVALSFSSAYSEAKATDGLQELRAMLPAAVLLWAGGAAAARIRKPIIGVQLIPSLVRMIELTKEWRAEHGGI
jgi:DNA-binding transcriptional MerR regulator